MEIWSWWWNLWNISWVWPKSLAQALSQWIFPGKGIFFKQIWFSSFIVIIWSVWRERNERIFNSKSSSTRDIKTLVLVRLWWWVKSWKLPFLYSVEEVIRNPKCLQWGSSKAPKPKISHSHLKNIAEVGSCKLILRWVVGFTPFSPSNGADGGGIYSGHLRNKWGDTLCSFSCPFPPMNPENVAVLAIHRAIQISLSYGTAGVQEISINSDSILAIRWCLSRSDGPSNLSFILNFIRSTRQKLPLFQINLQSDSNAQIRKISEKKRFVFSDEVIWEKYPK